MYNARDEIQVEIETIIVKAHADAEFERTAWSRDNRVV